MSNSTKLARDPHQRNSIYRNSVRFYNKSLYESQKEFSELISKGVYKTQNQEARTRNELMMNELSYTDTNLVKHHHEWVISSNNTLKDNVFHAKWSALESNVSQYCCTTADSWISLPQHVTRYHTAEGLTRPIEVKCNRGKNAVRTRNGGGGDRA